MKAPWYLNQHVNNLSDKFKYIQNQEDERLRDASLNPETSKWKLGVSIKALNDNRNRYLNIMPYEKNRVKLNVVAGNDYINASYIKVNVPDQSLKKGYYIATQGPTKNTWAHFWQMCYQKCPDTDISIIMLTPLVEYGREKCYQYWPKNSDGAQKLDVPKIQRASNNSLDFSEFETGLCVEFLSKTVHEGYQKSTLLIRPTDPSLVSKKVHHFYFNQWKDMRKPSELTSILKLSRHLHSVNSPNNTIIVHCSAGVGRSGTFITIDHLIHHTADFRNLSFLETYSHDLIEQIVIQLRSQRVKMVQLEEQFRFIYKLADYVFTRKKEAYALRVFEVCSF